MAGRVYDIIDGLKVGRDWKSTFKKIHIKYFRNYVNGVKTPPLFWVLSEEISSLPLSYKMKLNTWFNPLGLIFGPLYYIWNGLYIKGGIMLAILAALLCVNDATRFMAIFIQIYCACFVNIDCFQKKVLKHKEISSNPLIIGNDYDDNVLEKLLTEKTSPFPYLLLFLICLSPFICKIFEIKQDSESSKYLASEPKKICDAKEECFKTVRESFKKISMQKDPKEISKNYYTIGLAYYSLDDNLNSLKSLDTSISFDKENINSYLLRAKTYSKMHNNVQSLLDYKEALSINPKAKFLNYYIGINYYALGKYDRALEYFEIATQTYDDPKYFEAQAYTRYMLKDKQGAIKDIKKAIGLYHKVNNADKVKKLGAYLKTINN